MERNCWKLATIGIALTGVTALSTGLTTAWMLRPAAEAQAQATPAAPVMSVQPTPTVRPAVTNAAGTPPAPRITPAVARTAPPTRVTPVAATTTAEDCATGGDRAMRIAKPGAIGALLGAGLGAAGGAVVKGGSGAGKGALLGGLAGAALGAGYGAYKTQNECGTILGNSNAFNAAPAAPTGNLEAMAQPASSDRIQVYRVER
jgi:hypothetical protein